MEITCLQFSKSLTNFSWVSGLWPRLMRPFLFMLALAVGLTLIPSVQAASPTMCSNTISTSASDTIIASGDADGSCTHNQTGGSAITPGGNAIGMLLGDLIDKSLPAYQAATFTVNDTGDDPDANPGDGICATSTGDCTLRAAIQEANAHSGADTIRFWIVGPDPYTITPLTALPTIIDTVTIDGTTENNYAGTPVIVLNGGSTVQDGLRLYSGSDGSTIRGLVIQNFTEDGLDVVSSGSHTIAANFIGTDATGSAAAGNALGINLLASSNNIIGGTTAADRNVISGNTNIGIYIGGGSTGNTVSGNYIGLNAAGDAALANGSDGVFIWDASNNTIGGTAAGARNVISGNTNNGIGIDNAGATGNTVLGNYIGLNAAGDAALANGGDGVFIWNASNNTIGGTAAGARNVISGNTNDGIEINADGATHNTVLGNIIGLNAAGNAAWANGGNGIYIFAGSNNIIGGTAAGAGNIISGNSDNGITVQNGTSTGNIILGNLIYGNNDQGIDLDWNGVTANDIDDSDSGPNNLQNYPVLSSAIISGSQVTIAGALTSTANTAFTIEFFANTAQDPSGYGEGERFLGRATVTTNGSGVAAFSETLTATVATTEFVSATATDPSGNTSEFSANVAAAAELLAPEITVSPLSLAFGSQDVDAGATISQTVVITNDGSADLNITGIAIVGTGATQFVIESDSGEASLAPGASRTVWVSFDPSTAGSHSASLRILSNDSNEGTVDVTLSGSGIEIEPTVSFTAATQDAPEATGTLTITAQLSKTFGQNVTLPFILSGTSGVGDDYTITASPVVIPAGSLTTTITITVVNDSLDEPNETVVVTLGAPINAGLGTTSVHTATIIDDDASPSLTIDDVTVTEGDAGFTEAVFTVTLSAQSGQTVTVNYTTAAGTAGSPADYTAASGTLSFGPEVITRTITIIVQGDLVDEADEIFLVNLSNPTNASLSGPQGLGTIIDDDTIQLSLTKLGALVVTPGQILTYTIVISNTGDTNLTNGVISDTLPGYSAFIPGSLSLNPTGAGSIGSSPPTLVNNLTITAGQQITVTYAVTVSSSTPVGTELANSAVITSPVISSAMTAVATSTVIASSPVLTITSNGPAAVIVGQPTVFSFTLRHDPTSDGTAVSQLAGSSTLNGAVLYAGGDLNGNGQLDANEEWLYTVSHMPRPTDPNPLIYWFSVMGKNLANQDISAAGVFSAAVSGYNPILYIDKDGPSTANVEDEVIFTYTVINLNITSAVVFKLDLISTAALGDGSPIRNVIVSDDLAGSPTYVSGDYNGNNRLDANEGWVYTASYTIQPGDPDPLDSTVTVQGLDPENDLIQANDTHRLRIGAGASNPVFLPLILKN